ncbi:monoamine oxidase, partial [Malassezia obtusa]
LDKAGKKWVILEARDRIGGRMYSKKVGNGIVDVGAEFVGPTQDKIIELAHEMNVPLFPTYNKGSNIFYDGKAQKYDSDGLFGAIPPEDVLSLAKLAGLQAQLDGMAKQIDVGSPWKHPKAKEWDSKSAGDWLRGENVSKKVYDLIEVSLEEIFSATAEEMSLLYVVSYVAAAGNKDNKGTFERLTFTPKGAQQYRVDGGTYEIAQRLAKKLEMHKNIKLSSPVASITKQNNSYSVKTKSGKTYEAEHVIVAMSPPMAATIDYKPALPKDRQRLSKKMKMGRIGKGIAIYNEPFWRKNQLTGQAVSLKGHSRATFDSSPKDASFGAILGFIQADAMEELDSKSESEMSNVIGGDLEHYFGKQGGKPKEWVFMRWDHEEYSRGGPTAYAPPNTLSKYGKALREPAGNIHFAGTEASDYWQGYMDGAIRSGQRAAYEIINGSS